MKYKLSKIERYISLPPNKKRKHMLTPVKAMMKEILLRQEVYCSIDNTLLRPPMTIHKNKALLAIGSSIIFLTIILPSSTQIFDEKSIVGVSFIIFLGLSAGFLIILKSSEPL